MRYRVTFRYNRESGEVEEFRIDAQDATLRAADHDERHERVASDVAGVVEHNALIRPFQDDIPVTSTPRQSVEPAQPEPELEPGSRARELRDG